MLFQTSYSDSEGEDFDLGIDDDYIQLIDFSSSETDDEIEEIEPMNCLSTVDQGKATRSTKYYL